MAYTTARLGQGLVGTGSTTIFTATASTILRDMMLNNVNSAVVGVTVWVGSAATVAESIIETHSIPASSFIHWTGLQYIASAATIKMAATVANGISATVTGVIRT